MGWAPIAPIKTKRRDIQAATMFIVDAGRARQISRKNYDERFRRAPAATI